MKAETSNDEAKVQVHRTRAVGEAVRKDQSEAPDSGTSRAPEESGPPSSRPELPPLRIEERADPARA